MDFTPTADKLLPDLTPREELVLLARTLWRDRLVIDGPTAPLLWPVLWGVWQWRGARIRALAPTWAHDLELDADPVI